MLVLRLSSLVVELALICNFLLSTLLLRFCRLNLCRQCPAQSPYQGMLMSYSIYSIAKNNDILQHDLHTCQESAGNGSYVGCLSRRSVVHLLAVTYIFPLLSLGDYHQISLSPTCYIKYIQTYMVKISNDANYHPRKLTLKLLEQLLSKQAEFVAYD